MSKTLINNCIRAVEEKEIQDRLNQERQIAENYKFLMKQWKTRVKFLEETNLILLKKIKELEK